MMKLFHSLLLSTITPSFLSEASKPNIIFLLSDDQDWTETSVQMHPDTEEAKSSVNRKLKRATGC